MFMHNRCTIPRALALVIPLLFVIQSLMIVPMGTHAQLTTIQERSRATVPVALSHVTGESIFVDDDNTMGPWDGTVEHPFQTIQDGIDHVTGHATVYIFNGTYLEHIVITEPVILIGEARDATIIDAQYTQTAMRILTDGVTVENVTVRNSGGDLSNAGIFSDADNTVITNCLFYRTKTGIHFKQSAQNSIHSCAFSSNGEGIFLESSDESRIEGCTFEHNAIGVHTEHSAQVHLQFCSFHTNGLACLFNHSQNIDLSHCTISDNSDNHGGVFFTGCTDGTLTGCYFQHNGMGINIARSHGLTIDQCSFIHNTHFGLLIQQSSGDIAITHCAISHNGRFGLYIIGQSQVTVRNTNIENNMLHGLYVDHARCIARYNWWGSPFGPSYTELGRGSWISWKPGTIRFFPWRLRPIIDIRVDWDSDKDYMDDNTEIHPISFIELPGEDSDSDGVPDWWEEQYGYSPFSWDNHTGLDPDQDGLNNIEECFTYQWGSHPQHKDIFLEIDWVESPGSDTLSNKPSDDLLEELVSLFAEHDITLHIDVGELGGGEAIPFLSNFSFADLRDLYWDYFLHNDLQNPRKGVFHYGLICDYGPDVNFPFVGWDHFDSFLISAQWLQDMFPLYSRDRLIVGGAVHQLGSTLGLLATVYGGNDNLGTMIPFSLQWWKYRHYESCMNYYYKYKLLSYSDGTHGWGDFDDWGHLDFDFFKNSHFN